MSLDYVDDRCNVFAQLGKDPFLHVGRNSFARIHVPPSESLCIDDRLVFSVPIFVKMTFLA
jgi:hypothetical protein